MSRKGYFSYVRVSTQRQGTLGTSLDEQQAAIERYAERFNLRIIKQFEERETAAKLGRPVFLDMLKALRRGKAEGLIIHKIDRSARNLKDWADLGSLIDRGVEVHFANESLDLNSRGGRLSADIQAVVAADYIRNLREETKKGIYGRLRQGLFPFPARPGYLDAGKGKPKRIDPVQGPLVKMAFETYASGKYGLNTLVERMYELGLRNKRNKKISRNGLTCILKNPFYMGVIRIAKTGQVFVGSHEPIVSKSLFRDVQNVFAGKRLPKTHKHFFAYRRLISCAGCRNFLIAEIQKNHIYYRCQSRSCPQKTIREELIEKRILDAFEKLRLTDHEHSLLEKYAREYQKEAPERLNEAKKLLEIELSQIENKLAKLADAYVEGVFDKDTFLSKKNEAIIRKEEIVEKLESLNIEQTDNLQDFHEFLELLKTASLSYKLGTLSEKRELVQIIFSNCEAEGKSLKIKMKKPFQTVLDRDRFPAGRPRQATPRKIVAWVKKVLFEACPDGYFVRSSRQLD
ncbi:MAG: recombinase family protein [Chloracidobacterium sp.]|nr:recombinase family protein [Chloracidobacterium sp.]